MPSQPVQQYKGGGAGEGSCLKQMHLGLSEKFPFFLFFFGGGGGVLFLFVWLFVLGAVLF